MGDLGIEATAEVLDISTKTLRRYIKSGLIEARYIGGRYRISQEAIDDFMERQKVKPTQEPPRNLAAMA